MLQEGLTPKFELAVNFRVTQVVDKTLGIHGAIPKRIFVEAHNKNHGNKIAPSLAGSINLDVFWRRPQLPRPGFARGYRLRGRARSLTCLPEGGSKTRPTFPAIHFQPGIFNL